MKVMKVLIIGGGGREHALAWKIRQQRDKVKIYAIPGNGGICEIAECVEIDPNDICSVADFAEKKQIELTIVGPELPLSLGIVDEFNKRRLAIFGPTWEAAQIESSKILAKELMVESKIPTAGYRVFIKPENAISYVLRKDTFPIVVKADGLMAGKGVKICQDINETRSFVEKISALPAGKRIILEDCLEGEELSFIAFTDGETILPLLAAQDYKELYPGGPNTGGMGAFAPLSISEGLYQKIMKNIMVPAVEWLRRRRVIYQGILYAGLMIMDGEPHVLEFNCRFGDPETQPVMMLLETDLIHIIQKVLQKKLHEVTLKWRTGAASCVVLASGGYPGPTETGKGIYGLEEAINPEVVIFHSGTKKEYGFLKSSGGRVLGVTARGNTVSAASARAYQAVNKIEFEGMCYRRDIGRKNVCSCQY